MSKPDNLLIAEEMCHRMFPVTYKNPKSKEKEQRMTIAVRMLLMEVLDTYFPENKTDPTNPPKVIGIQ